MECFIVKEATERKASLEDLFSIIGEGPALRYIMMADIPDIHIAAALAYLPDEVENRVYSSLSPKPAGILKKEVSEVESEYEKNSNYVKWERTKLINSLGEYIMNYKLDCSEFIIFKDIKPKEAEPIHTAPAPLDAFIKSIDEACVSGSLQIESYNTNKIAQNDIQNAFQSHCAELHKIRSLTIDVTALPAAALLFKMGKLESLYIRSNNYSYGSGILEFPSFIRNITSLRILSFDNITSLPDWIDELQSLTELSLSWKRNSVTTLPDSIGNLRNLVKLTISFSQLEYLPDCISNLRSLRELSLRYSSEIKALPNSIGNLENLVKLDLDGLSIKELPGGMVNLKNLEKLNLNRSSIEKLPDWIGDLQSLTELSLNHNGNLKDLPDGIGNLKKLVKLDLHYSAVEKLPDSIVNCGALEFVDISKTQIRSVPDFFSSVKAFSGNVLNVPKVSIELIPRGHSLSYRCFCNSYYKLVETILRLAKKAREKGLLELEDDITNFNDNFFSLGMRLVVDGTDSELLRGILQTKLEREGDYYRKTLMKVAMAGVLGIQTGDNPIGIALKLASIVKIKNNPLDAAFLQHIGILDAFCDIDLKEAIQPEEEREEISFVKRAVSLLKISRKKGLLALEEYLDHDALAARDVFERGLLFTIMGWDWEKIEKVLSNLIEQENDPVQKNLAQAKNAAVKSICTGDYPRNSIIKLCAYFDESITRELENYFEEY